ncbi:hypothetical protein ACWDYJ_35295 [Streptomyces sp. NPDC003042]
MPRRLAVPAPSTVTGYLLVAAVSQVPPRSLAPVVAGRSVRAA